MEEPVEVFRALADPTRRALLDALFDADGQSVGALCVLSPEMTRFGVMKHLRVLEEANLVTTAKSGRTKLHYLNPVPIAQIAHRWISKYAAPFASALVDLDDQVAAIPPHRSTSEGAAWTAPRTSTRSSSRPLPIRSGPRSPTRRGPVGTSTTAFAEPPRRGPAVSPGAARRSAGHRRDGRGDDTTGRRAAGTLRPHLARALRRGAVGRTGRPGRVDRWRLAGQGLTRVRLVHSGLEQSPLTWENVKDGWVWVLDA